LSLGAHRNDEHASQLKHL